MADCDLCSANGPVYDATCPECRIRDLASGTGKYAGAAIREVRGREGDQVADELKAAVINRRNQR